MNILSTDGPASLYFVTPLVVYSHGPATPYFIHTMAVLFRH
jgi:hypothetical protein